MWKLSAEERVLVNPAPVAAAAGLPEVAGAEQHLHCSRSRFWGSKRVFLSDACLQEDTPGPFISLLTLGKQREESC